MVCSKILSSEKLLHLRTTIPQYLDSAADPAVSFLVEVNTQCKENSCGLPVRNCGGTQRTQLTRSSFALQGIWSVLLVRILYTEQALASASLKALVCWKLPLHRSFGWVLSSNSMFSKYFQPKNMQHSQSGSQNIT